MLTCYYFRALQQHGWHRPCDELIRNQWVQIASGIWLQVNSLRELVEDWDFQEGPFMEFVAPALQLLAGLLHTSGELETQLQVCLLYLPIIMQPCRCPCACTYKLYMVS